MKRHILVTGSPGVGKTTLIASRIGRLPGAKTGFLTREVREDGIRKGFIIETLSGISVPLAVAASAGLPRVGKYRVLSESIQDVAVRSILGRADFIVIDELGTMGGSPESFMQAVHTALAGPSTVIAAVAANGNPFIEGIKTRPDARPYTVTRKIGIR